MKPQTALDICNLALAKLGEAPINAITPFGKPAQRLCYKLYHPTRREVLCANRWKFATHTKNLKFETEFNGEYGYSLPLDCLRVWEPSPSDCSIRGRALFCSEPEITLVYTADDEAVEQFDPAFIDAFATALAAKICMPLTFSVLAAGKLDNEYKTLIS